jgi:NADH dehydrogenase FAD-containing subunit
MMTKPLHYVIIGSGSAGFGAAKTLREGDKQSRITMITMDALPFYNRYDLPDVFRGKHDWHKLLAVPPSTYEEMRIELRRLSRVVDVDGPNKLVSLAHQEQVAYDRLLVCAGGRSYLPENLIEFAPLMHGFGTFEAAMRLYNDLLLRPVLVDRVHAQGRCRYRARPSGHARAADLEPDDLGGGRHLPDLARCRKGLQVLPRLAERAADG